MKGRKLLTALAAALLLLGIAAGTTMAQDQGCAQGLCPDGAVVDAGSAPNAQGLTNSFSVAIRGGHVAAGVGLRNTGHGTIALRGIPPGASVYKAFLYWNIVDNQQKSRNALVTFGGRSIYGTYIGGDHQPGWTQLETDSAFSYRADVTSLVRSNGNYAISNVASGRTDGADPFTVPAIKPLAQGASLVVVFSKSTYPLTRIWIWDGATTVNSSTSEGLMFGPFPASNPVGPVYATFVVADGQSNGSEPAPEVGGVPVAGLVFNGSSPRAGANFSNGNLWDTKTASVGRYLLPAYTYASVTLSGGPDILTWVAQVLSVSAGTLDTDGDSFLDGWEANGYDPQSDGRNIIDLPAMGASPFHKDFFIEHDWMTGTEADHKPSSTVLARNVAAFATAPVTNPDGVGGIRLHNDIGQGGAFTGGNQVQHQTYITTTPGCSDAALWGDFDTIKAVNFDPDRARIFHYVIWGHDICPEWQGVSGVSRGIPGKDFLVTLGSWSGAGSTDARTGTLMHEFGHNIGLTHGGASGDHVNYKPNHLSVMNYSFQVVGVWRAGAYRWDYTRMSINALNENSLNEVLGLSGSASLASYGTRYYCGTTQHEDKTADTNVDWNCNGSYQTSVATNINKDAYRNTLGPVQNQWTHLVYNALAPGAAAPILAPDEVMNHPCLSYEDLGARP